jgi:hypothetical protein
MGLRVEGLGPPPAHSAKHEERVDPNKSQAYISRGGGLRTGLRSAISPFMHPCGHAIISTRAYWQPFALLICRIMFWMLRKPLQRAILIGLPSPPGVGRDSSWKSLFLACFQTSADTLRDRAIFQGVGVGQNTVAEHTSETAKMGYGWQEISHYTPRLDMGGKSV